MRYLHTVLAILLITNICSAQADKSGCIIKTASGDVISFDAGKHNTLTIKSTGETRNVFVKAPQPVLLNDQKIYCRAEDFKEEVNESDAQKNFYDEWAAFCKKLRKKIKREGIDLPSGTYVFPLKNAVMGINGRYVYYEATGVQRTAENPHNDKKPQTNFDLKPVVLELDEAVAERLNNIFDELYQKETFTPLVLQGNPTPWVHNYSYRFSVK